MKTAILLAVVLALVEVISGATLHMDRVEGHLSKNEKRLKKYLESKDIQWIHNAAYEAAMDAALGRKFGPVEKMAEAGAKVLLDHPYLDMRMLREHLKTKGSKKKKSWNVMYALTHNAKSHNDKKLMKNAENILLKKETEEELDLIKKKQQEKKMVDNMLKEKNLHVLWTPLTEEQKKVHYMEPKAEHLMGLKELQEEKLAQIVAHDKIEAEKKNKVGYRWHGLGEFFKYGEYVPDWETKEVEDHMGKVTEEDKRKAAEKKYQREHAIKNYEWVLRSHGGDANTVRILNDIERERQYAIRDHKLLNVLRHHKVLPGGMVKWGTGKGRK